MQNFIARVLIALLSLPFPIYVSAEELALPSEDLNAPIVIHLASEKPASAEEGHIFTATVTDDKGVSSVVLFYRESGSMTYNRLAMTQLPNTDEYTAFLEPQALPSAGLEYYIQAKDIAGNSLLRGYSFSPLKLSVRSSSQPTETEAPQIVLTSSPLNPSTNNSEEESIWTNKWLWIGLGILAVGAAAAGGGGGNSTSTSSDDSGGGATVETGSFSGVIPFPE